ncbi:MAG: TAXI family TRAP transporter solute-binding subunit [Pseudomonadota bacterium]|nr:TAXI family TRAP transporter solute-binding subunit [Pseudomonadota bacterium]
MKKPHTAKELIRFYSYGIFIVLLGFVVTYQFIEPAPPSKLILAAGAPGGAYLEFAKEYQTLLAEDGISLEILETSGSMDNLSLLAGGKVDAALMQSGIASPRKYPELLGLGSLYFEPLWVFTRQGFNFTEMSQINGKKVVLGSEGSGTRKVVLQLFKDNGIEVANLAEVKLTGMSAVEALQQGSVDFLFLVSAVSSPMVISLLDSAQLSLINFVRADAYARRHNFLSKVILPQGVVNLEKNIPAQDVMLVAPAATLVVRESLHPALAGLLTQVIAQVHGKGSLLNSYRGQFPSAEYLDFPLSDDADRFYRLGVPFMQRYLPFWIAIQFDRMKLLLLPLLALFIPLLKILPLTYRWRMRSRIYRWYDTLQTLDYEVRCEPSRSAIEAFFVRINEIEEEVRQISVPLPYAAELYGLRHHIDLLRRQIGEIKEEVVGERD